MASHPHLLVTISSCGRYEEKADSLLRRAEKAKLAGEGTIDVETFTPLSPYEQGHGDKFRFSQSIVIWYIRHTDINLYFDFSDA